MVENPQAFPTPEQRAFDGAGLVEGNPGMSLRDWFAGQALAPMVAAVLAADETPPNRKIAIAAYSIADAMLAARREPGV